MKIKPTMSMFVTIDDLNKALVIWHEQERAQLIKALGCAVRYIEALEGAVESCGDIVEDAVYDNCPATEYSHDRAKELSLN